LKYVVIRDDDISYFTPTDILDIIYGKILEENKVNFGVIPNVYSSIDLNKTGGYYKKEKLDYDPLINPEFRGTDNYYSIEKNYDLIEFLNNKNVGVIQHGYSHEKINNLPEFSIDKKEIIYDRAIKGKSLLNKCLKKDVNLFLPPWNVISKETFDILHQEYKGIIIASMYPIIKNFNILSRYYLNKIFNKNYLLFNNLLIINNYILIDKDINADSLNNRIENMFKYNKIVVIQNHYWDFFDNWKKWGKLNKLINTWEKIYNYINNNENIKIIDYQELRNLLITQKLE
jgi:hypothetical protein